MLSLDIFYNKYKDKFVKKTGGTFPFVQNNEPYAGQCVSLVQAWLKEGYGLEVKPRGNAIDFTVAGAVQVNFNDAKDGDIVIYELGRYGHIGIVCNGGVFNQNPYRAKINPINAWKISRIIRPKEKTLLDGWEPMRKPRRGCTVKETEPYRGEPMASCAKVVDGKPITKFYHNSLGDAVLK